MTLRQLKKKSPKKYRILGVMTGLQVDFLNDSKLFQTFEDLNLIELIKGFNLRHLASLGSLRVKNDYVITKIL